MSTTGKVFAVLNVLLSIGFVILIAPVADFRYTHQKAISELRQEKEPLPAEIVDADRERFKLSNDLVRAEGNVTAEISFGQRLTNSANVSRAELRNDLNDRKSTIENLGRAFQNTRSEIDDRESEIASTKTEISALKAENGRLGAEVAKLDDQLAGAKDGLARTLSDNEKAYADIKKLEDRIGSMAQSSPAK